MHKLLGKFHSGTVRQYSFCNFPDYKIRGLIKERTWPKGQ